MDDDDGCLGAILCGITNELDGKYLVVFIIVVAIILLTWYAVSPDTFLKVW